MAIMKKNPDSQRAPAGLEWKLFKKLPALTLAGLIVICLIWAVAHLWRFDADTAHRAHTLQTVDFALIGLVIFHLTMVLTVALGCLIVMIMKGPQYTADSYELQDADAPLPEPSRLSAQPEKKLNAPQ